MSWTSERFDLKHILLTHAHVDHVSGVARAKRYANVPIHLHREDLFLYDNAVKHGALFGLQVEQPPPVDHFYEGSPITFGDYTVTVHHTPGHCPGGVCLAVSRTSRTSGTRTLGTSGTPGTVGAPDLFVGDTLFAGSIGGSRARTKARNASRIFSRVLRADQAERHLRRRLARDHGLGALPGIAADRCR